MSLPPFDIRKEWIMKDKIKNKLDEHVIEILAKPTITNEDYTILREKMAELAAKENSGWDMMWISLLMMLFSGLGGAKE